MPAVSKAQQQFMAICSHSPGKAKGKCPPAKVAEEFSHKPSGGYSKGKSAGDRARELQHIGKRMR
jgi:hypothetical protein